MLLPFTDAVVPTVDLAGGRVVIELPQEIEGEEPRRSRDGFDMTWRATILTLFPEMFPGPLGVSLAGKALASGLWALEARDIRASATDNHRSVDDTPAGGGPGMVLRADVLAAAIDAADIAGPPAPPDEPAGSAIDPVAGGGTRRRPGPPDRLRPVRGHRPAGHRGPRLEEVSIGDYVLSGGEIAAMALIDACVRLLPGVMGKQAPGDERAFPMAYWNTPSIPGPQEFEGRPSRKSWFRRPCQGRGLASGRGRSPDPGAAAGFMGPQGRQKGQKTRQTGDKRAPDALYGRQIRAADRWTFAQPAHWLGAPPMEISMNIIQQLEKEQFDKLAATKEIPEFGARRHPDRQRQGGRRRAHPRAGL